MAGDIEHAEDRGLLGLNGKTGEFLRWVAGLAFAAIVSYFTAQASVTNRLTAVETTQRLQFEEIQRSLVDIKVDLRDVKTTVNRQ